MENIKIGFIGCGTMGSAIATRVAMNQRYCVYVSDYSSEIAESLAHKIKSVGPCFRKCFFLRKNDIFTEFTEFYSCKNTFYLLGFTV